MNERRKCPRVEKILPIKLSVSEFDILTETNNISASGTYFSLEKPLELMTKLNVVLLIPIIKNKTKIIEKISCTGIIVRCEIADIDTKRSYRAAMHFNNLKERDKKILLLYIRSLLKASWIFLTCLKSRSLRR